MHRACIAVPDRQDILTIEVCLVYQLREGGKSNCMVFGDGLVSHLLVACAELDAIRHYLVGKYQAQIRPKDVRRGRTWCRYALLRGLQSSDQAEGEGVAKKIT